MAKSIEINNGSFTRYFIVFGFIIVVIVFCSAVVAFDPTSESGTGAMTVFVLVIIVGIFT